MREGGESREHSSRDGEEGIREGGAKGRRTEVEQRLCDVPRTLLSDPVGLRRAG